MEKHHPILIHNQNESQKDVQQLKKQVQHNPPSSSSSSSPSHDFTFTISLHTPSTSAAARPPDKTKPAIDLSPADEIFFHGHLLPLHLLSHLPTSPRSSTNSLDSFTLPIKDQLPQSNTLSAINDDQFQERSLLQGKTRGKSKSFSLFGWKTREKCNIHQEGQKRKPKIDVTQVLKRYLRLVKPFLTFGNRNGNSQIHRQAYSFSGNLKMRNKKPLRGAKGEFSAPASIITSPTNSGLLVGSGSLTPTTSDSTMEELQAAIQAAIAHCKKSIATEDKIIKLQ